MNSTLPLDPLVKPDPRVVKKRVYQFWDQVSIYLPILLMGLLALASYWLLRATPIPEVPPAERELVHEPDYHMRRFSVKVFDANGRIKSEVYGAEGRHYPDTDTLEMPPASGCPDWSSTESTFVCSPNGTSFHLISRCC